MRQLDELEDIDQRIKDLEAKLDEIANLKKKSGIGVYGFHYTGVNYDFFLVEGNKVKIEIELALALTEKQEIINEKRVKLSIEELHKDLMEIDNLISNFNNSVNPVKFRGISYTYDALLDLSKTKNDELETAISKEMEIQEKRKIEKERGIEAERRIEEINEKILKIVNNIKEFTDVLDYFKDFELGVIHKENQYSLAKVALLLIKEYGVYKSAKLTQEKIKNEYCLEEAPDNNVLDSKITRSHDLPNYQSTSDALTVSLGAEETHRK